MLRMRIKLIIHRVTYTNPPPPPIGMFEKLKRSIEDITTVRIVLFKYKHKTYSVSNNYFRFIYLFQKRFWDRQFRIQTCDHGSEWFINCAFFNINIEDDMEWLTPDMIEE